MAITLTNDQENAKTKLLQFLCDPNEHVFVLEGYSGTGKTTLVRHILEELPNFLKTVKAINPKAVEYNFELSATTNKAAEALSDLSGLAVKTVHSALGLRVIKDIKTGKSSLGRKSYDFYLYNTVLFVDEASYIDHALLKLIFQCCKDCKIVFLGDRAQLTPVMSKHTPVFQSGFKGAMLTEVVRNEGQILELATKFRETVASGDFFQFTPNGQDIIHLEKDEFKEKILSEFTRSDWHYKDSKILAWTNERAVQYNHFLNEMKTGDTSFKQGDYAICNQFISNGSTSIKTDDYVHITDISPGECYGYDGFNVRINHGATFFLPAHYTFIKDALKVARSDDAWARVNNIERTWIDLRNAFACTVNKAQGSTFNKVFIDVADIAKCNSGDQIARMMYVAVSRARTEVNLVGDF